MRNLIVAIVVAAAAAITFIPTEASAWTCYARGSTGATGWATGNLAWARQQALYQCAIRTPRGARCWLTGCN